MNNEHSLAQIGVLAASILMFTPSMNVASLVDDLYYWLVFLCIVLAIPGILLAFTQKASIMSCVFIGTYTTILPIGSQSFDWPSHIYVPQISFWVRI